MPFVPTPAAFFSAAGGVVIRRTFLPERGGGGWNPRHSFLQVVLLSAAQFAGQLLLYRLLSCTQFRGAGIGIPRTVYGGRGCYRQHNFGAVCIAGQKKMVVIGRTIRTFFCGRQVVIHSTICAVGKIRLLLSAAHFGISSAFQTCPDRVVIQRTFPAEGLLSGAQFPNCRILAAVVIDGTVLKNPPYSAQPVLLFTAQFVFSGAERLLSGAQFAKIRFFCSAPCRGLLVCAQFALQGPGLLSTAQYKDFSARVVIQRTFPRGRIFPSALLECCAHFSLFLFPRPGLLYSTLFKNPTKFSLSPFSCKKIFFYRCYAPHIVAFYTFVLECCAQHRCNTAHICIGIFDIAIPLF